MLAISGRMISKIRSIILRMFGNTTLAVYNTCGRQATWQLIELVESLAYSVVLSESIPSGPQADRAALHRSPNINEGTRNGLENLSYLRFRIWCHAGNC